MHHLRTIKTMGSYWFQVKSPSPKAISSLRFCKSTSLSFWKLKSKYDLMISQTQPFISKIMSSSRSWLTTLWIGMLLTILHTSNFAALAPAQSVRDTVSDVRSKIVKIMGSGGFQGLEPYQSGFLVSSDGYIVTVWSYVLDSDAVTVTLDDGTNLDGKLIGYDPRVEMAILKVEAGALAFFDLQKPEESGNKREVRDRVITNEVVAGQRILAFSNLFGVATGNEPVSVQMGVVAARTQLRARRGSFNSPYRDEVLILDAMTNNPGSAGGAVTDLRGGLIGMIGKELKDEATGNWLNFAIPMAQLSRSIREIRSGRMVVPTASQTDKPTEPITLALLGIRLVPDIVSNTPPFVDAMDFDSAATRNGLKRDDLIIEISGKLTPSIKDVVELLSQIDREDAFEMTVQRGAEFVTITMSLLR